VPIASDPLPSICTHHYKEGSAAIRATGAVETFIRREDAERFIEEVRRDDPDLASYLRIEERELSY
jgi:hypothetical protein